jgi:DNA helicase-2/ATP-dependent DNA helicase PcrA
LGKTLRSERGAGTLPTLAFLPNQDEEARFCASLIENSVKAKRGYSQWAILYRTNAQSLGFETEFLRRNIPYRVVGSLKFYEREEIKDAIALLAFLANPRDEVAFRRVVNKPARGVGAVTVERLIDRSLSDGGGLMDTAEKMLKELTSKARNGLGTFVNVIKNGKALLEEKPSAGAGTGAAAEKGKKRPSRKSKSDRDSAAGDKQSLVAGEGLSVCVSRLINDSGLAEYHVLQDEITGNQRLNNLQELANAASLYAGNIEGLLEFLEHIELDRSREETAPTSGVPGSGEDKATLITFHNTKGLEFKKVIMTGLEQGVFPRENKKDSELEEERRLFYVGATRAMDELYLTSCRERRMYGMTMRVEPSVFLREIDRDCLKITGAVPGGFNAGWHPWEGGIGSHAAAGAAVGKSAASEAERESGWRRGQRLFHDDYGYGEVTEVRDSDEGPVVRARFETGKELRFLGEQQGSAFVKISGDC